jgi:hypothetical protein
MAEVPHIAESLAGVFDQTEEHSRSPELSDHDQCLRIDLARAFAQIGNGNTDMRTDFFRMTFYESSAGPRLVLFGPLTAPVHSLRTAFLDLIRNPAAICFGDLPFIRAHDGVRLVVKSFRTSDLAHKRVKLGIWRIRDGIDHFEWWLEEDECEAVVERLDVLSESQTPAHQYLTGWTGDYEEVSVVVSIGECVDEVLAHGSS